MMIAARAGNEWTGQPHKLRYAGCDSQARNTTEKEVV